MARAVCDVLAGSEGGRQVDDSAAYGRGRRLPGKDATTPRRRDGDELTRTTSIGNVRARQHRARRFLYWQLRGERLLRLLHAAVRAAMERRLGGVPERAGDDGLHEQADT